MNLRERIRSGIDFENARVVEIGALYRPFALKSEGEVCYVDWADTETLRERYKEDPKFNVADIVEVDAVWGEQTLQDCVGTGRKFDYVIASHVVEHVPDLITWTNELTSVLTQAGQIRLVIPDKRFTFDYTRRVTELSDVIDAYIRRARVPLPRCILDHVINVRRVDTAAAWEAPLSEAELEHHHSLELAMHTAKDSLERSAYHDVHCWVFTPHSFASLMRQAAECRFIDVKCDAYEDTLPGTLEFTVFLRHSENSAEVIESWRRMELASTACMPQMEDNARSRSLHQQLNNLKKHESEQLEKLVRLARGLDEANRRWQLAEIHAEAYRRSRSWRVTAPIRAAARLWRSLTLRGAKRSE